MSRNFLSRIANFKVVLRYFRESAIVIRQGARLKDKFILLLYYCRIPLIIIKSLFSGRHFRQIEEENKFLTGDVLLRNKNGLFYCGKNMMTVYIADEQAEKHLYPYFELKAGCFIDIGAHIGKYTVKTGRNPAVTVISLEPDLFNFMLLEKNIALNKLTNIIPLQQGAFSASGEMQFYLAGTGEGQHSAFKNQDSIALTTIQVDTLDNIILKWAPGVRIHLIKIDTEGAEAEILKGAREVIKKDRPDLIVEILKENSHNLEKIKELLDPYDYKIEKLDNDNYFCSVTKPESTGI